jgi:phytoene dehydrogenase-like protein
VASLYSLPIKASSYQKTALCYYYGTYDIEDSINKIRQGIYHEGKDGFLIYVPSATSPEMAPRGFHCITIYTVAPDEIKNGDWEIDKEKYAKQFIHLAEKYLPGLSKHIFEQKIMTPLDYRKLAHLKKSAFGGVVPLRGIQNPPHKTPVDGLIFVGQQSENAGSVSACLMGAIDAFHLFKSKKVGGKI